MYSGRDCFVVHRATEIQLSEACDFSQNKMDLQGGNRTYNRTPPHKMLAVRQEAWEG